MHKHLQTTIIIIALCLNSGFILAQTVRLSVQDNEGRPIPYTTVFTPSVEKGLITDKQGGFSADFTGLPDSTSVVFSAVGHKTIRKNHRELTQLAMSDTPVVLPKEVYTLAEIQVADKRMRLRQKRLGLEGVLNATFQQSVRTAPRLLEAGPIIRPKKRCRLDTVELKVKDMDADTIILDINVYAFRKRRIKEQLLRERVIVSLAREEVGQLIKVDLLPQNLWIDGDFVVTFRLLEVIGEYGSFAFKAKTGKSHGLSRREHGEWEHSYLTPALFTTISYEE